MTPSEPSNPDELLRLNVFLARAGHGSRRGVEDLVTAGRVTINEVTVRELGRRVNPTSDTVRVDGLIARIPTDARIYAFHKPLDVVCTMRAQGDQVDLEFFRKRAQIEARFQPVGRLDHDSSGLLLWTDDGLLAQSLMHPTGEVWKTYEVKLTSPLGRGLERKLTGGRIELDGRPVRECRVKADDAGNRRLWTIQLHEGRKRQIRRMFAVLNCRVSVLTRTAVGPVSLGRLRPGDFRRLTQEEDAALRQAAGAEPGNA